MLKYYISDISNPKKCLGKSQGKYFITTDPNKVKYFSTKSKAKNVIDSGLSNKISKSKCIILTKEFPDKMTQTEFIEGDSVNDVRIDFKDVKLNYSVKEMYENVSKVNMFELENEEKRIGHQLNKIHKGLTDINHSLEMIKLDAVKRSKLSVVQTKLLDKRRELKTDLEIIKRLKGMINPEFKPMVENRTYVPRVFNELFDGIIPDVDKFLEEL